MGWALPYSELAGAHTHTCTSNTQQPMTTQCYPPTGPFSHRSLLALEEKHVPYTTTFVRWDEPPPHFSARSNVQAHRTYPFLLSSPVCQCIHPSIHPPANKPHCIIFSLSQV
jgi:hypothetical protein